MDIPFIQYELEKARESILRDSDCMLFHTYDLMFLQVYALMNYVSKIPN